MEGVFMKGKTSTGVKAIFGSVFLLVMTILLIIGSNLWFEGTEKLFLWLMFFIGIAVFLISIIYEAFS